MLVPSKRVRKPCARCDLIRTPARGKTREAQQISAGVWLFDDFLLETLDKRDYIASFSLGHLEFCEGRSRMTEETFQSSSLVRMPWWVSTMSLPG